MRELKRIFLIMLVIGTALTVVIAGLLFIVVFVDSSEDEEDCVIPSYRAGGAARAALSPAGLMVKGHQMTTPQARNASAIVQVSVEGNLPVRAAEIAIMTAIQESTLTNISYGYPGSTSLGLFQQIAAWGPESDRMDPSKSSYMFYFGGLNGQPGLTDVNGWESMDRGDAAQAVQGSGFPDAYDQWEQEAIAIVASVTGGVPPNPSECDPNDPIEQFVQAAKGLQGETASGDEPKSGAKLIEDAAGQAGFCMPGTIEELSKFENDEECGVTAKFVSLADIRSGNVPLEPGMVPLLGERGETDPRKATTAGVYIGSGGGLSFRISSFNIYYSTNPRDPVRSTQQWQERLQRSVEVIKNNNFGVVGLQEVRLNQWSRIQAPDRLNSDQKDPSGPGEAYGIYPTNYRAAGYGAQNPIVWDKYLFELVEGKSVAGYQVLGPFDGKANTQVKLRFKATGQEIYVINHHEPVGNEKKPVDRVQARFDSAKHRADYVANLEKQGLPVFLTGDFNSSYNVNIPQFTVGNNRNNLAYCILTENNLLWDAWDASLGKTGKCPTTDKRGVDHIYMSTNVAATKYDYTIAPPLNGSDVHNTLFADVELPSIGNEKGQDDPDLLGYYVAVNESGVIDTLKLRASGLIGALQLTVTTPVVTGISGGWVFPLPAGTYTYNPDSYGVRFLGSDDFHNGTDFRTNGATPPLVAMHDGIIVRTGFAGAWGNHFVVETNVPVPGQPGKTYKYLYAHLSSYVPAFFTGTSVKAGQVMGNVGDTGNSFGEHLHLTICTDMSCTYGNQEGSIDPVPFLVQIGILPGAA